MGSEIEMNDTLQITSEQGFPSELDYEQHQNNPFTVKDNGIHPLTLISPVSNRI